MPIDAGAAVAVITPEPGLAMGGYGARVGVAGGTHDDLCARTLVWCDGATTLALVVCDLVAVSRDLVSAARERIEAEHGLKPDCVCITATHTHSGPGTLTARHGAAFIELAAGRISDAVGAAIAARGPVRMTMAKVGVDTVGRNRRHPDGPYGTELVVLRVGEVASLLNFACHATVLEHDNLQYSADFPGAAVRALEREVGGVGVYLQGACGDVNPLWMRHDFEEVARIGGILGLAAARAVHELAPLGTGQWVINLSWSEEIEVPAAGFELNAGMLRAATEQVALPRRVLPPVDELDAEIARLRGEPGDRSGRERLNQLEMERVLAGRRLGGGGEEVVELQAFRLGADCALLALPGEFFVETGAAIAAQSPFPHLLLACYANDYIGYVAPAGAFPHGGYEVGVSRFGPDAEAVVVTTAQKLLASL